MAIRSQGTTIQFSVPGGSPILIGEVVSFEGPGAKATTIDVTSVASPCQELIPGVAAEGSVDLVCNFASNDAGQQALIQQCLEQAQLLAVLTLSDATTITFWCYVIEFRLGGKSDSKVEATVSLLVTGLVNWSNVDLHRWDVPGIKWDEGTWQP